MYDSSATTLMGPSHERRLFLLRKLGVRRFGRGIWIGVGVLVALLLLPLTFFPLAPDAAIYFVSGEKILQGAVHYRDIVDVKPPLIYHIYAVAIALFGHGSGSIRVFDFLLQLATCFLMARLIRRATRDDLMAAAAPLIYAVWYVSQSFNSTSGTECFVGLLLLPMIWLYLYRRTFWGFVAIGALAGVLFQLKYTLGLSIVALAVAEILVLHRPLRSAVQTWGAMLVGLAVVVAMLPMYLTIFDVWGDFSLMNQFLRGYVRTQGVSPAHALQQMLTLLPTYFAENYSVVLSLATLGGILLSVGPTVDDSAEVPNGDRLLLRITALCFLALMLSAVVEAKYRAFHMVRLLPIASVLSAAALVWMFRYVADHPPRHGYARTLGILAVAAMLLFSPLPRYVRHAGGGITTLVSGDAGFDRWYGRPDLGYTFTGLRQIGEYIASHRRAGDQMFAASSIGGMVHYFARQTPDFKIYHSAFYIAPFAPRQWIDSMRSYLMVQRPRFFVMHLGDSMSTLTGTPRSSEEAIRALPGVDSLLRNGYDRVIRTYFFDLYVRREP